MSNLLFFTDCHLASEPPAQRHGDYGRDILTKLEWVVEQAPMFDYVLFGGDFVHSPAASLRLVHEAVCLLSPLDHKLALCWGQHDLGKGHVPAEIGRSSASLLYWGLTHHTGTQGFRRLCLGELDLALLSHHPQIEEVLLAKDVGENSAPIVVAHALIGLQYPFKACTMGARLVLSGDWHEGYPPHPVGDTWFANPGALARVSIDDYGRVPQVAAIQWGDGQGVVESIEYVPVPCRPAPAVFDLEAHLAAKEKQGRHSAYVAALAEGGTDPFTPVDDALAGMELETPVRKYVQEKLTTAQEGAE